MFKLEYINQADKILGTLSKIEIPLICDHPICFHFIDTVIAAASELLDNQVESIDTLIFLL